jgi:predicted ArsR family transcriptional regulator
MARRSGCFRSILTQSVRWLLSEHIFSYEQLEVLLLVHRERRSWRPEDLARALQLSVEAAGAALEHLEQRGLVEAQTEDLKVAVEELSKTYTDNRLEVMVAMNENAMKRVRTAAMRTFADSFVWKKKDG